MTGRSVLAAARVALALRRAAFFRPWGGHTHIRAVAQCLEAEWEAVFDAVAEAAHEYDEQLFCSGHYDTAWRIGTVDILAYRMGRRATEALRHRVRTALVEQQPSGMTSLCRRCRCTEEPPT